MVLFLGACGGASELPISTHSSQQGAGATGGVTFTGGFGGTGGVSQTGGFGAISAGGAISVGGSPPLSECTSVATLTSSESLIADFECLGGSTSVAWLPINGWPHGAYSYYDDTPIAGVTWTSQPVFSSGYGTPGHASTGAIYIKLTKPANNWGAGQGIWWGDAKGACIDASAFTGIRFWAKGASMEHVASVTIGTFETSAPPNGSCTLGDQCSPYGTQIKLTPDWTRYEIRWTDVTPGTADVGAFDPGRLNGSINFHVTTWSEDETLEMWVDDIEFTGASSEIPRTCR